MTSPAPLVECPSLDLLSVFLLQDLPEQVSGLISIHIEGCEACQKRLSELTSFKTGSHPEVQMQHSEFLNVLSEYSPNQLADDAWQQWISPTGRAEGLGRVEGFLVKEVLGAGGMGIVFKALDQKLERAVAIKMMRPSLASRAAARKQFVEEARALAAVENQHVVPIHHVGEHNGIPYFVMKLLEGETLSARLNRVGKLEHTDVVRLAKHVASGLEAIHQRGRVHLDVKLSNIWIESEDKNFRLMDFGLVRPVDDGTIEGKVAGSPDYMSPEQISGKSCDSRSDLYSLGVVLLQASCGKEVSSDKSMRETFVRAVTRAERAKVEFANRRHPLGKAVTRLLLPEPALRFESAGDLLEAIENEGEKNSSRLRSVSLIGACALLIAILGVVVFRSVTDFGELTVEVADGVDASSVSIRANGPRGQVLVLDQDAGWSIRARSGEYEIDLGAGDTEFTLTEDTVTVKRNHRVVVTLRNKKSKRVQPEIRTPRTVAEWVIEAGGTVLVTVDPSSKCTEKSQLPPNILRLHTLDLRGTGLLPEDLYQLKGLLHVQRIHLGANPSNPELFADEAMRILASLDVLHVNDLLLDGLPITRQGLQEIAKIDSMNYLHVKGGKFSDDALGELSTLPELSRLSLMDCRIDGAGLKLLADTAISALHLNEATLDVAQLQDMPNWNLTELHVNWQNSKQDVDAFLQTRVFKLAGLLKLTFSQQLALGPGSLNGLRLLPDLKYLNLTGCSEIFADDLNELTGLSALADVRLVRAGLSDEHLIALKKTQGLKKLDIRMNSLITEAAKIDLQGVLSNCTISSDTLPTP